MDSSSSIASYNRLLLFVAGLGGLLYGIDVGIIASALPYLEATSHFTSGQLSFVVAAVFSKSSDRVRFRRPLRIIPAGARAGSDMDDACS